MHSWICCQSGAREHYAVSRAIHRRGLLECLLTDCWWPRQAHWLNNLAPATVKGRNHPDLDTAHVESFNFHFLLHSFHQHFLRKSWYLCEQARNRWFQNHCVKVLQNLPDNKNGSNRVVFAYSYAAREILKYARVRGWLTVLGQFDPGPRESEIVLEEYKRLGLSPGKLYQPPAGYWEDWKEETDLANRIVVNSSWSARCLEQVGVPSSKLEIIPCAFEIDPEFDGFVRSYPDRFTNKRPLRVLFLGQTIVRKGIHLVIEAANKLRDQPIQFTIVGGGLDIPSLKVPNNTNWVGPVSRVAAKNYYRNADVFLLPTLSDGFALTQLEALAWKLPVIVTRQCGDVVTNNFNGVLLPKHSSEAIIETLIHLASNPPDLMRMSKNCGVPQQFSIDAIGSLLTQRLTNR